MDTRSRNERGHSPGEPTKVRWGRPFPFSQNESIYTQRGTPLTRRPQRSGARTWPDPRAQESGGVYIISVAARILHMHPQTLRKYERIGFVTPSRTVGMLRLYSQEDIAKLRLIKHLVENLRFNLAGVEMTLSLVKSLLELQHRLNQESEKGQKRGLQKDVEALLGLLNPLFHNENPRSKQP